MLSCICIGRSKIFFYWFCYTFEIAILYWKSIQIFLLKINRFLSATFFYWKSIQKISIEFTVHFELAILYWKPIQMFPLKINWFLSASFSYWKSIQNLPLIKTLSCIRIGTSKTFFFWFCYIFKIAILYWFNHFFFASYVVLRQASFARRPSFYLYSQNDSEAE